MIDSHGSGNPLDDIRPVTDAAEVTELIETVQSVHVSDEVRRYVVDLISATRRHPDLRLGASPRATLHLVRTARAAAALDGRPFVVPDDVQTLAPLVLAHRLIPTAEAQLNRRTTSDVVSELVRRVPLPGTSSPTPPSRRGR
jgi:MoxR-like ATPase